MVSVAQAESIILNNLFPPEVQSVPITDATGCILAESVVADRDLPPFNRVSMDGIAILRSSLQTKGQSFTIAGTQAAGQEPLELLRSNEAIEVMTGALLPKGTDTVVRYEDLEIRNSIAAVLVDDIRAGQNIHRQAQDARKGDLLLRAGLRISPAEIALLASVGKSRVAVFRLPKTAIVSTGDELVDTDETPRPWQIRRSNSYALQAAFRTLNHTASLFHLPDNKELLEEKLQEIFNEHPLVVLSGGVSKGKFDYVPEVLEKLGIKKLFHRVSQKPGKPFWFGKGGQNTVFALPGNPVSTYLCFYRYIKPWLERSMDLSTSTQNVILARDFSFAPDLTYFVQVNVKNESGQLLAYPDEGGGSGDFTNLKDVTGFIELPMERSLFKAGEIFSYIPFRE